MYGPFSGLYIYSIYLLYKYNVKLLCCTCLLFIYATNGSADLWLHKMVQALGLLPPSPPRPFTSPDKTLMEQLAPLSPPPINGEYSTSPPPPQFLHSNVVKKYDEHASYCPSDPMHVPQIPCMSLRSHVCPSDPMHVPQIPCMSLRSHACPSDPMHVPQIPCMSLRSHVCPSDPMHVPQIPCMSLRSHACPSDPMHVPQIPCMSLLHACLILVTLMIPNIV